MWKCFGILWTVLKFLIEIFQKYVNIIFKLFCVSFLKYIRSKLISYNDEKLFS